MKYSGYTSFVIQTQVIAWQYSNIKMT